MPLEVAAMLPSGALIAYNAVIQAKALAEKVLETRDNVNILIVGAGGLGQITLKMAQYFLEKSTSLAHIVVADGSLDRLENIQKIGCYGTIHWDEVLYEEYMVDRTFDQLPDGVDIAIDFVSSVRTIQRCLRVLNQGGTILAGGNSRCNVKINLDTLAANQHSIIGIHKGTVDQLEELVRVFAAGKISPPPYSIFPVEDATDVFSDLSKSKIQGRAVLKVARSENVL